MSPNERRNNIYAELRAQRHLTINYLAEKYSVNEKTIRRDIDELTLTYPIETVRGRYGGGIKLADWYHPMQLPPSWNALRAGKNPGDIRIQAPRMANNDSM